MAILLITSVRAKWRLEPGASDITSEALSLDCLLRGWQEGRTLGPQAGASPSPHLSLIPSPGAGAAGASGEGGFPGPLGWSGSRVHDHVAHVEN